MKNLNIVSFNLRLPAEIDGDNYFFNRLPLIVKTIRRRMPDIIGVQEATDASREALAKELPEYTLVGSGRNPDRHGEGVAFLFRKDKFELSDLCCRWLSNTPFTPGSRYEDSDQSPCPRFMLSALFVPKDTEIPAFRIYNLHTDHVGAEARMRASRDLLEAIRRDNENYAAPFLALGDFNEAVAEEAVGNDENVVAALGDVGNGHFHRAGAGAGKGEGNAAAVIQGAKVINKALVIGNKAGVTEGLHRAAHFLADGLHHGSGAGYHNENIFIHNLPPKNIFIGRITKP